MIPSYCEVFEFDDWNNFLAMQATAVTAEMEQARILGQPLNLPAQEVEVRSGLPMGSSLLPGAEAEPDCLAKAATEPPAFTKSGKVDLAGLQARTQIVWPDARAGAGEGQGANGASGGNGAWR